MVKKRRRHLAAYKLRIALEALEGSKTISQLSQLSHAGGRVPRALVRAGRIRLNASYFPHFVV